MKTLMAIAMILARGTYGHADASWHHMRLPPQARSFMGSVGDPSPAAPLDRRLGTCNGGPCTLTGGPSGGPNQS